MSLKKFNKHQTYSMTRRTSQDDFEQKQEKQISFSGIDAEKLGIVSSLIDVKTCKKFPSSSIPSAEESKALRNQLKSGEKLKTVLVDTFTVKILPLLTPAFPLRSAVDAKAQCVVSYLHSTTSVWGVSFGSLRITADHVLVYWRLRSSNLTTGYIFADESSGSVKYVAHNGEGNTLMLIAESSLSSYPAPESVDIDSASNDPRVFFLDQQGGSNIQGFLIPSSSWSDKSLSVKLDGATVTLAAHDVATADEWVICPV